MCKKRNDKESMIFLTPKPSESFFFHRILSKEFFFFTEKGLLLRKGESGGLNKKRKEGFLSALVTAIKKDPTMSIRKHAYELKVHEKTERTVIKLNLNPDNNPLDYTI